LALGDPVEDAIDVATAADIDEGIDWFGGRMDWRLERDWPDPSVGRREKSFFFFGFFLNIRKHHKRSWRENNIGKEEKSQHEKEKHHKRKRDGRERRRRV
jgi:hypothetical protein